MGTLQNGPKMECGTMGTSHPQWMIYWWCGGSDSVSLLANFNIHELANMRLARGVQFNRD